MSEQTGCESLDLQTRRILIWILNKVLDKFCPIKVQSKVMYQVFENDKLIDYKHGFPHGTHECWKTNYPDVLKNTGIKYIFDTVEEAHEYALNWLGLDYGTIELKVNEPYDYNGYIIEIREIKV